MQVADAKAVLSSPVVHGRGWEGDTQIWCYFCEVEVQKHRSEDDCVLVLGSFIKHLARCVKAVDGANCGLVNIL